MTIFYWLFKITPPIHFQLFWKKIANFECKQILDDPLTLFSSFEWRVLFLCTMILRRWTDSFISEDDCFSLPIISTTPPSISIRSIIWHIVLRRELVHFVWDSFPGYAFASSVWHRKTRLKTSSYSDCDFHFSPRMVSSVFFVVALAEGFTSRTLL